MHFRYLILLSPNYPQLSIQYRLRYNRNAICNQSPNAPLQHTGIVSLFSTTVPRQDTRCRITVQLDSDVPLWQLNGGELLCRRRAIRLLRIILFYSLRIRQLGRRKLRLRWLLLIWALHSLMSLERALHGHSRVISLVLVLLGVTLGVVRRRLQTRREHRHILWRKAGGSDRRMDGARVAQVRRRRLGGEGAVGCGCLLELRFDG